MKYARIKQCKESFDKYTTSLKAMRKRGTQGKSVRFQCNEPQKVKK